MSEKVEYKDYVIKLINGDLKCYEYLVDYFQGMAVGYAYSILHDFQLAEDAAQEAFILLYYNIKNLKEPAAFASWLRKIVFTCCNRIIRRKRNEVPLNDNISNKDFSEVNEIAENNERSNLVEKAVLLLKKEQQEVLILHYTYNKSYREMAVLLGISESAVANRLYSAKKKLKNIMLSTMIEYLGDYKMDRNNFTRKVLQQVPHIVPQNTDVQENFYFCAAMRACAQYFGENQAFMYTNQLRLPNKF